jgi:CRP-like cAMP-binding protein
MVSPELLRRYPFFALLNDEQLKAIAMIAREQTYQKGTLLVKENTPANTLMLLLEGDVDLIYSGGGEGAICNALVGSIAPGEILGVSSLIELPLVAPCPSRWLRSKAPPCAPSWRLTRNSVMPSCATPLPPCWSV